MSFDIALSGLNAVNTSLDTISNNIANSGTFGFKSSRANFASIYAGSQPTGTNIDSLTQSIQKGGNVVTTGRNLDVSIQGRGFFATRDSSGTTTYTRVGIFNPDKDGFLVDSFGRKVQGYTATAGTTTLGTLGDLSVPPGLIAAQASDTMSYVSRLSSEWTVPANAFDITDPTTYNSAIATVVYDSLGTQHTMTQYFVQSATPGEVNVQYAFDGTDLGTSQTLQFDTDGNLTSPTAAVAVTLGTPNGANQLDVNIDYTGTVYSAGESITLTNSANGYSSGVMKDLQIDNDGSVMAQYSNGQKQLVGMLALATFPDENALVPVSDTAWVTSNASGEALYSTPGTGIAGNVTGGSLEQSNVDVANELVGLMVSQRNYQANSKVISTENQMLQSLMQAV